MVKVIEKYMNLWYKYYGGSIISAGACEGAMARGRLHRSSSLLAACADVTPPALRQFSDM